MSRLLLALLLATPACGGEPELPPGNTPLTLPAGYRRLASPELEPVRAALEAGEGVRARTLLERVQGFEAGLLRARALFLTGDTVAALAELEELKRLSPADPEVLAVEIELLAALDRLSGAAELLQAAMKSSGRHPALLRAQGVIELRNSGRGREALAALERARALDPELPFLRFPLAQAQILAGRLELEKAPAEALAKAQAAERLYPGLTETLELEAEAQTGLLDFGAALAAYAALAARGQDHRSLCATLEQRWSTRCLLERDRVGAVEHALSARELGLSDEELGFGADLLAEAAGAALAQGRAALEASDWGAAETAFARQLELDPHSLEGRNLLGLARFRRDDFRGAAEVWSELWSSARLAGLTLPDPVPIHLAKAWRLAGEPALARATLDQLVDGDPDGPWSAEARELLLQLEVEELAGR